jgi:hypothetical protein
MATLLLVGLGIFALGLPYWICQLASQKADDDRRM